MKVIFEDFTYSPNKVCELPYESKRDVILFSYQNVTYRLKFVREFNLIGNKEVTLKFNSNGVYEIYTLHLRYYSFDDRKEFELVYYFDSVDLFGRDYLELTAYLDNYEHRLGSGEFISEDSDNDETTRRYRSMSRTIMYQEINNLSEPKYSGNCLVSNDGFVSINLNEGYLVGFDKITRKIGDCLEYYAYDYKDYMYYVLEYTNESKRKVNFRVIVKDNSLIYSSKVGISYINKRLM